MWLTRMWVPTQAQGQERSVVSIAIQFAKFFCRKVHAYLYIKDKGQEKLPWITWTVKVP